jgi:hypothetical protein
MRSRFIAAIALWLLSAFAPAIAEEKPSDCLGIDFDAHRPAAIAKIAADKARVNFVKSAWQDAACPAATDACTETASLVPGALVLTGKSSAAFICATYQSADDSEKNLTQNLTNGWLPSASLAPVAPAAAPVSSDWIGGWVHAGAEIDISDAANGGFTIHGEAIVRAAQDTHNGVVDATAKPEQGIVAFADDGRVDFDKAGADACLMRMRRAEALLVVEDNGNCGGADVSFTGFYRKKQ